MTTEGMKAYFPSKDYEAAPFSKEHFHTIRSARERSVFFIDGGNAELLATPNYALQFIRVAVTAFRGKQRTAAEKKEWNAETEAGMEGNALQYATAVTGKENAEESAVKLNAFDRTLSEGGRVVQPGKIGGVVRRRLEIAEAIRIAEKEKNAIIVLDGTLEAAVTGEKDMLEKLYAAAQKNENIVAAVAKTSTLLTEHGEVFSQVLMENGPAGAWWYHPVAESRSADYQAAMCFAKLHAGSRHVFRIDVHGDRGSVMEALAATANDLTFPGYPYGLILADTLARVSDQEAEYMRVKAMATASRKRLAAMQAINAHDILDSM